MLGRMVFLPMLGAIALALAVGLASAVAEAALPPFPRDMRLPLYFGIAWIPFFMLWVLLRNSLNKVVGLALATLFFFGQINAAASYIRYGAFYHSDLLQGAIVYVVFATGYVFTLWLSERILGRTTVLAQLPDTGGDGGVLKYRMDMFVLLLLGFAFIWFGDQVHAVGRIPILSGDRIIDDMYQIGYGRLYGYGIYLAVAGGFAWTFARYSRNALERPLWFGLVALFCFFMVFDGRRVFLILFLLTIVAIEAARTPWTRLWKTLLSMGMVVLALYILLLWARQGGVLIGGSMDTAKSLTLVGVEYRDFAYVVSHFEAGELRGYEWFRSFVGGGLNWILLALAGFSKGEMTFAGSAYQLAIAYRSNFGIRIGLIGELYLAYGWFGLGPLAVVAFIHGWISDRVARQPNLPRQMLFALSFAVLTQWFVGQNTAVSGYLVLILYLVPIYWFFESFRSTARVQPARPPKNFPETSSALSAGHLGIASARRPDRK